MVKILQVVAGLAISEGQPYTVWWDCRWRGKVGSTPGGGLTSSRRLPSGSTGRITAWKSATPSHITVASVCWISWTCLSLISLWVSIIQWITPLSDSFVCLWLSYGWVLCNELLLCGHIATLPSSSPWLVHMPFLNLESVVLSKKGWTILN